MAMDLDIIGELLQDVNNKCDELLTFKAVHEESHKSIDNQLLNMKDTLYKNPSGLTYQIEYLLQHKKHLKNSKDYWRTFWFGLLRMIASAAIIGLFIWFLSIYKGG